MTEREHRVVVEGSRIITPRLLLRPWTVEDAEAALRVYGAGNVARWLAPAMERVADAAAMRTVLERWVSSAGELETPAGRWAIELRDGGRVVGGVVLLPLPPDRRDLEIGWQLAPDAWGQGLAAEAGHAVAHHAFASGVEELFAVVRPRNERGAATARRVGMEWVGETDKYYGLTLQVFRLRPGDLDVPALRPEQWPAV
ncbi:GNAT family N-acetyltransferase [Streptomyces sp. NPDC101225]|uniref:GNAT family N-acetyltransferase n=1 Tax=Streptomyces sp. NPDC101225 TaxID=3366135 RepID=UPI00381030D9